MIKLRDLLRCCGGGDEVYIMGDSWKIKRYGGWEVNVIEAI